MTEENEQFDVLGKRITECRKKMNMTQEELANRIGVTPQALSQYERGTRYPDVQTLKVLCAVFKTSADYLIGLEEKNITETGANQNEIWRNLRTGFDSVKVVIGEDFVPSFKKDNYFGMIADLRRTLSLEGSLLPVVRLVDLPDLNHREFMILAYDNILYQEEVSDDEELTAKYIITKLGEVVRKQYDKILSVDIVKNLIDNLKINHPALVEGIIPEIISYSLLTEVCKGTVKRGNTLMYLPKMIEVMQALLRDGIPRSDVDMIDLVTKEIENENNFWVVLGKRN